jgi:hypothetical protein
MPAKSTTNAAPAANKSPSQSPVSQLGLLPPLPASALPVMQQKQLLSVVQQTIHCLLWEQLQPAALYILLVQYSADTRSRTWVCCHYLCDDLTQRCCTAPVVLHDVAHSSEQAAVVARYDAAHHTAAII